MWVYIIIKLIQIHLMLLFIVVGIIQYLDIVDSNTSHVIVYPGIERNKKLKSSYSNTSHVIVYQIREISAHHDKYSNTSHVIVYLRGRAVYGYTTFIQIHLMLLFITKSRKESKHLINSNTSHVIVYLLKTENFL